MGWFSKPAGYLALETQMSFNLRSGRGVAAIRWNVMTPHPQLTEVQAGIALAALQYARTLCNHEETRAELYERVGHAATSIAEGAPDFPLEPWHLTVTGCVFQIWPWVLVPEVTAAKVYIATLVQTARGLDINLKMAWGQERVLAPSAALLPLYTLALTLDEDSRRRLGRTLTAVNRYYGSPNGVRLMSEGKALQAALPALLG